MLALGLAVLLGAGLGCGDEKERDRAGVAPTSSQDRPLVLAPSEGPRLPREIRITDVSQVQRQPDGTLRRVCGAPPEESRRAMEQARRQRMAR